MIRVQPSISLEKYRKGKLHEVNSFKTFDIDPSVTAELTIIDGEIEDNKLILKKSGELNSVEKAETTQLKDEALSSPRVNSIEIVCDYILEQEGIYIVEDDIKLLINDVVEGSYKIDGIYYSKEESIN